MLRRATDLSHQKRHLSQRHRRLQKLQVSRLSDHRAVPETKSEGETHGPGVSAPVTGRVVPQAQESSTDGRFRIMKDNKSVASNIESKSQRVQRLVDTIWDGWGVTVKRDSDTGDFDAFATSQKFLHQTEKTVESPQQRRQRTPYTSTFSDSSGWQTVRTAVKIDESKDSTSNESGMTETSSREQEPEVRPDIVVRMTADGMQTQTHHIRPIPIKYDPPNQRRPHTPSIYSEGSELECSSPLFLQSCDAAIREGRDLGDVYGQIDNGVDSGSDGSSEH